MDEPTPLFHGSWVQPALSQALLIVFFSRSTKRKQLLLFSFYSNQAWQWLNKKTFTSPFIDNFPTKIYILLGDLPLPCLMTWVYLLYPWHWGSSWRGGGPGWRELICPGVLKMFWCRWLTYDYTQLIDEYVKIGVLLVLSFGLDQINPLL